MGYSSRSIMLLLFVSTLSMTEATPKERLKVKYKVKTGEKGERMKVGEEVMENNSENSLEYLNTIEYKQALPKTHPDTASYKDVVTTMMGQLERAARSEDLTIGDLVFDVVKEVIAETLGGLVTRGLGLGAGRSGGGDFSFMGTVMRAVAKVGRGGGC